MTDTPSRLRRLLRYGALAAGVAASASACAAPAPPRLSGDVLTLSNGAPARSPGGAQNPSYRIEQLKVFPAGKYRLLVSGVLCNACTRAIVENLKALKGVESASYDYEEGILWLTVKKDSEVRATKVSRAVVHAGRRVRLGTRFAVTEVRLAE